MAGTKSGRRVAISLCNIQDEQLTVPNHGSKEIGKGLQLKIMKLAGFKNTGI